MPKVSNTHDRDIIEHKFQYVNTSNCLIISVTEGVIVASELVLPKGGKNDATQHNGICPGDTQAV